MRTKVYITIDVEASIGGAWEDSTRRPLTASKRIFCRDSAGREYGIPLIVSEFARFGFRGSFFCETISPAVPGDQDIRPVFEFLLHAGQDVQLHVHPTFRHYAGFLNHPAPEVFARNRKLPDQMSRYSEAEQSELLSKSVSEFTSLTGRRPEAFRAGGYAADRRTLRALKANGITIDSSFNPLYSPATSFPEGNLLANCVQCVEGVWEFPVTIARSGIPESGGLRPFDISVLSVPEMVTILNRLANGGTGHAVVMFHSFSAAKAKDVLYSELRPDRIVIRRLRRFLEYLDRNRDRFEVATFADTARNVAELQPETQAVFPYLGKLRPAIRKAVQLVNRVYYV